MNILSLPKRATKIIARKLNDFFLSFRFKHIHGPRKVSLQKNKVSLVLVGRNNGCFLEENIRHHREKGVHHVVYIDNGSSDNSIDIVKSHPNTTVFSTNLSFYDYQSKIRKFAVSRIVKGGWVLAIDCDEIFDYVGSDRIKLPDLVSRISQRGNTCLVAQMLDLVPDCTLEQAGNLSFSEAIEKFSHYSLREIRTENYTDPAGQLSFFLSQNESRNEGVKILYGGLRKSAFGEDCCLTKHALFQVESKVTPFAHPHVSTGLDCADFTALLKHYKFACGVMNRERKLVDEHRMANGEIDIRVQTYQETKDLNLISFADRRNPTPQDLVRGGFLFFSDRAKKDFDIV